MDCFVGRNASRDVFPKLYEWLENPLDTGIAPDPDGASDAVGIDLTHVQHVGTHQADGQAVHAGQPDTVTAGGTQPEKPH